jgi:hypothetical protein
MSLLMMLRNPHQAYQPATREYILTLSPDQFRSLGTMFRPLVAETFMKPFGLECRVSNSFLFT